MPADLKALHEELAATLAELDRLTAQDTPDQTALASARLRLSRASGNRRRLVETLTNKLLETASPAEAEQLRGYRERNAAQLHASTSHIGKWGLRHVMDDWQGYRAASVKMRQSLRDLMADDRTTLYPLLVRTAS
jgi:hypothetical protein